jgi:hypothetical protein
MNIGERIRGYIKERAEAASAQEKTDLLVANTVLGIFENINIETLGGKGKITHGLLNPKTMVLEWGQVTNPQTLETESNRIMYEQRRSNGQRYCIGVPSYREKYEIDIKDPDWKERLEIDMPSLVELGMCHWEGPRPL